MLSNCFIMIKREKLQSVVEALKSMPIVALIGPRQVGKTTLAYQLGSQMQKPVTYIDLESDADFNKLSDAEAYLSRFTNHLLIIDEVQRMPDLFRLLRVMVDKRKRAGEQAAHFLLLGSASKELLQRSSETLAGRIRYIELTAFTATELFPKQNNPFEIEPLWLRGGFPDSYLAPTDLLSLEWRKDFFATYVERDIPSLGVGATQLSRFWRMLAHYHASQINLSEFGRNLGVSHTTIRNYLDILTDFYMVRQLQPWSGNIKKRLIKSPKVYIRDSGILHSLLQLSNMDALLSHPIVGASWEGFIVENIVNQLNSRWECFYYRTATGVELDLVLYSPDNEVWAIEIKRSLAPKLSRGFYEACKDINATHKWVVYAGIETYPLPDDVKVVGLLEFLKHIQSKQ